LEDNFSVENLSELLKSTQKTLISLRLPSRLHSNSGNIVKLFPELSTKPRLMSLQKLSVLYDNSKERNQFCPTLLEELITNAPNISFVKLCDSIPLLFPPGGDGPEQISSSFEVLSVIEKLGREPVIQELIISHYKIDDSDYIELLRKMGTKKRNGLKKFEYESCICDLDKPESQPLLYVISLFKDTLQLLKIHQRRFVSLTGFQKMKCLTQLSLTAWNNFNSRCINLKNIFPVLKRLHIHTMTDDKYDSFFPDSETCPSLKCLQLTGFSLKINGFNQMLTVFPNVTNLQVSIKVDGEEILRRIWTQMTQLESLIISGVIDSKDSVDSVFTGISDHALEEITKDVINNLETMARIERRETILSLRNQHSQFPSIGDLTKLKSLTLSLTGMLNRDGRRSMHLTDLTGYFGFYSIQTLKELTVGNCEMTKTCCEILTRDSEIVELQSQDLNGFKTFNRKYEDNFVTTNNKSTWSCTPAFATWK